MTCTTTGTSNQIAVSLKRGDTMRLLVELLDDTGAPVDVTGWSWLSQLRITPDDTDSVVIAVTVPDPPGGSVQLELDPAVTAALPIADYVFDLEATDGGGAVKTLIDGQLRVREDVSR